MCILEASECQFTLYSKGSDRQRKAHADNTMNGIGFDKFRFCPLNTLYRGSQFVQREIIGEKQRGVDSQTQQIRKPKHQLDLYI